MERVERLDQHGGKCACSERDDEALAKKIWVLLGSRKDLFWKDCDAQYYDFSVIPHEVRENLKLYRDAYMLFGITDEAKFVIRWIDRWEFDSPPEEKCT